MKFPHKLGEEGYGGRKNLSPPLVGFYSQLLALPGHHGEEGDIEVGSTSPQGAQKRASQAPLWLKAVGVRTHCPETEAQRE